MKSVPDLVLENKVQRKFHNHRYFYALPCLLSSNYLIRYLMMSTLSVGGDKYLFNLKDNGWHNNNLSLCSSQVYKKIMARSRLGVGSLLCYIRHCLALMMIRSKINKSLSFSSHGSVLYENLDH